MSRLAIKRIDETTTFYDVSGSVKFWGRRGVMLGGAIGFALGAAFVAIPFSADVLTFGVIGTLIVAAVEGAVIAGAFAMGIAAIYGKGEICSNGLRSSRSVSSISSGSEWLNTVDAWEQGRRTDALRDATLTPAFLRQIQPAPSQK